MSNHNNKCFGGKSVNINGIDKCEYNVVTTAIFKTRKQSLFSLSSDVIADVLKMFGGIYGSVVHTAYYNDLGKHNYEVKLRPDPEYSDYVLVWAGHFGSKSGVRGLNGKYHEMDAAAHWVWNLKKPDWKDQKRSWWNGSFVAVYAHPSINPDKHYAADVGSRVGRELWNRLNRRTRARVPRAPTKPWKDENGAWHVVP